NLLPIEPLDGARAWKIFAVWKDRAPGNLPYGTWRDHSRNAQRDWYDRTRRKSKERPRDVSPPAEAEPAQERPLSADGQRAIEDLVNHVTRGVTSRGDGEDD